MAHKNEFYVGDYVSINKIRGTFVSGKGRVEIPYQIPGRIMKPVEGDMAWVQYNTGRPHPLSPDCFYCEAFAVSTLTMRTPSQEELENA
jgi:hypothetical protein